MNEDLESAHLDAADVDKRVAFYKAVLGVLPNGAAVAEALISRIPGQRIDRLVRFIRLLSKRIEKLEAKIDVNSADFAELFEEAAEQAARSHGVHRAAYLVSVITVPAAETDLDWQVRRKLLQLMRELTDYDIEVLIGFKEPLGHTRMAMRFSGQQPLTASQRMAAPDAELFSREAERQFLALHLGTLARLGLVVVQYQQPNFAGFDDARMGAARAWAECNDSNGERKVAGYRLSGIGKIMIAAITGAYPR